MRIKDLISRSKALIEGNVYLAVDDATNNVTQKVDYKTLAREIIEQYNLSTLAGSAQSVKSALDGLDGNKLDLKAGTAITNGTDVNTLQTPGTYFCASASIAASLSNIPTQATSVGWRLDVARNGYNTDNYLTQTITGVSSGVSFEYVRGMSTKGTWGEWLKAPTRAEVDALSNGQEVTTLTSSYGTLTYKCYKIGKLVAVMAQLVTNQEVPVSSHAIEGLPYTNSASNFTPITARNYNGGQVITFSLRRLSNNQGALYVNEVIPSGASVRMNFVYANE